MKKTQKDKEGLKNIRCLVLTPFDAPGARVTDAIERALRELSINVIRLDQILKVKSIPILERVMSAMESCDFIIADLSRQNPNIMYEIGFAHALRKPTLMIISSKEKKKPVPEAFWGWLFLIYDPSNFKIFQERLIKFVSEHMVKVRGEDDE